MTRSREAVAFLTELARFGGWRLVSALSLIVLGALFEGVGLLLLVPVVGVVAAGSVPVGGQIMARLETFLPQLGQAGLLAVLLGGFLGLMILRAMVLSARDRISGALHIDWTESVRGALMDELARAPWPSVSRLSRPRVVQALGPEVHQLGVASDAALRMLLIAVQLMSLCLIAIVLAPLAGPLALVCLALAGWLSRPYLIKAHEFGRDLTRANLGMTDRAMRFLDGLKLAAAEGERDRFAGRFAEVSAGAARDKLGLLAAQSSLRNLSSMLIAGVAAGTLFAGVCIFHVEAPRLIALLLVLARATGPGLALQQVSQQFLNALPAHAAISSLRHELGAGDPVAPFLSRKPASAGAMSFTGVSFQHPDGRGGVRDLDLIIPEGDFVGIAGPSGAGKTTFLDLVSGLLQPQNGTMSRLPMGRDLAYVGQDAVLFDGAVRDNLLWFQPKTTDDDLWAALRLTQAETLVRRLGGLDSPIGERGILLSAGERQRLALARALVRRPRLLILDEATNAIDLATEAVILDGLANLAGRPTILMAAHRPESFRRCDTIVRFTEGRFEKVRRRAKVQERLSS